MIRLRWMRLWQRLGAHTIPDSEPLLMALNEAQRFYHTLTHVRDCLFVYDHGPIKNDVVELALWMHDAIYDPQAHDNEKRSALWCQKMAADAGVKSNIIDQVVACILATQHTQLPSSVAEQLTVSIDLSILSRSSAQFIAYDRAIRREYAWVPINDYRHARAKVLRSFLERSHIYPLPWCEIRWGKRARVNIRRALHKLH